MRSYNFADVGALGDLRQGLAQLMGPKKGQKQHGIERTPAARRY